MQSVGATPLVLSPQPLVALLCRPCRFQLSDDLERHYPHHPAMSTPLPVGQGEGTPIRSPSLSLAHARINRCVKCDLPSPSAPDATRAHTRAQPHCGDLQGFGWCMKTADLRPLVPRTDSRQRSGFSIFSSAFRRTGRLGSPSLLPSCLSAPRLLLSAAKDNSFFLLNRALFHSPNTGVAALSLGHPPG